VLAVPHQLRDGTPFPDRDLIIVFASGVIVLTLLQALVLPPFVPFARLPPDGSVAQERHLAEVRTTEAAYAAIDEAAEELGTDDRVVDRVRHEIDKERTFVAADGAAEEPVVRHHDQFTALRLALLSRQRDALIQLRDDHEIDDIVLRQVQNRLDLEETRLQQAPPPE
jgi:hypothetical protein